MIRLDNNALVVVPRRPIFSRARGFSLVELMVAMAIGLVLLGVVGSIFLGSRSTFLAADQRGRVNESTRLLADVMGSMARQAAYVDIANTTNPDHQAITFEDIAKPNLTGVVAVFGCTNGRVSFDVPAWSCTANTLSAGELPSDSLVLSYQSVPADATVANSGLRAFAGGLGGDCNGQNPLPATANATGVMPVNIPISVNEFYVGRGVITTQGGNSVRIPEVYCRGNGNPTVPQPIAQGVEQMRVSYDVYDGTGYSLRLRRAADANAVGTDWGKVAAVNICLVTLSPNAVGRSALALSYTDCDGAVQNPTDTRMRRVARLSYSLRNRTNTFSSLVQ